MKPLIVLLSVFGLCIGITVLLGNMDIDFSGRIAMSAMLAFTAMGHFKFTDGMAMMLPAFIPATLRSKYSPRLMLGFTSNPFFS